MKFMHRHQRLVSLFSLSMLVLGGMVPPASGYYKPETHDQISLNGYLHQNHMIEQYFVI